MRGSRWIAGSSPLMESVQRGSCSMRLKFEATQIGLCSTLELVTDMPDRQSMWRRICY